MSRDFQLTSRQIVGPQAAELYLTASPLSARHGTDPQLPVELFSAVADEVRRCGGRAIRARIFVPSGCDQAWHKAWATSGAAGGPLVCSWLAAGPGAPGGVQVHAISGVVQWQPITDDGGGFAGWMIQLGADRWAVTSGLTSPGNGDGAAATRDMFLWAARLIGRAGFELTDVARTWFFLNDILSWYDQFNAGRTEVFKDRGVLVAGNGQQRVPASTGIGIAPASGSNGAAGRLLGEFFAADGPEGIITRRPAAGRQRSAYEYGSAFSRASSMRSPGGRTVFVSGTAAIDAEGRTCCLGDAAGQIGMTLDNVTAVLTDMQSSDGEVVEAMAYCKTPAIAEQFARDWAGRRPWPWVIAVGDVCRDDLLFEVEVTACGQSR